MSKTTDSGIELYSFTQGQSPVDTGVGLSAGASLKFGPGGDLFAVEYAIEGDTVVSQFGLSDGGGLVLLNSATGPITGECGIAITPTYAGCPINTGPQIAFDPPVPFDQVLGDSHLAGSNGTGVVERTGSAPARWQVTLDSEIPINCDDNTCEGEWLPGPSGSAIYAPYLETSTGGNHLAVFVVDNRAIATGALIDTAELVLGLVGTDLICVQQVDNGEQLIAIDLATLFN